MAASLEPRPGELLKLPENMMKLDKNKLVFLALVIIFGVFFICRVFSPFIPVRNITMTIVKQKGSIITLDTPVNQDFSAVYYINTINFRPGQVLYHNDLGNFAYSQDFFMYFKSSIRVEKAGFYTFNIASDDGFRLKLNGQLIGEFISNRSFDSNQYRVFLAKGYYAMDLSYFQGYGLQGLTALYSFEDGRYYYFGEDSPPLSFIRH
jgi:hypothetical protein